MKNEIMKVDPPVAVLLAVRSFEHATERSY
jgi:hypothetical protein